MTIRDMRVIPVAFPDPPLRNSTGVHEPYALRTLVRLETDEGRVGWGEAQGGKALADSLEATREHVVGHDPWQLEPLRLRVPEPRVYSSLEVACFDLMGQAAGRPVCDLLGGRVRERTEYAAYLFYHMDCPARGECLSPETILAQARALVTEHGFHALKLKGGVLHPDEEIETIRLLRREFGPDFRLRHDPNAIWSVETSIRVTRALEGDLEYMEDPTEGTAGMAAVNREVTTPLSTNMCVIRFEHFPEAIRQHAVDVVLSDHHYWGGLVASRQMAKICATWGLGVSMHSNSHLGISLAAMTHLAAATPELTHACDTHYVWLEEDILVGGKWRFEDGYLSAPTSAGLGIQVNETKVAEMAEAYRACGLTRRDDAGEMRRKYDPEWQPLRPRW